MILTSSMLFYTKRAAHIKHSFRIGSANSCTQFRFLLPGRTEQASLNMSAAHLKQASEVIIAIANTATANLEASAKVIFYCFKQYV